MKYRKKPIIVEATEWITNGDHPEDNSVELFSQEIGAFLSEGKVVRRYNHPNIDGNVDCHKCGMMMKDHGWIDTLEGGHVVCVGDYIIKGVQGEFYPCKPDIFEQTYERVSE